MDNRENFEGSDILNDAVISLQWFPGHMAKTRRMIEDNLKLVDVVAEILDARIPRSSKNPILDEIAAGKPRIVLLNKADLSDPQANLEWKSRFAAAGISTVFTDSTSGKGFSELRSAVNSALERKQQRDAARGMNKAARVMVVGIPNVGKSSFINRIAGEKRAKSEDRPGVTRGKQWIAVKGGGMLLLDTPGILWPKFDDKEAAFNLAFTGAIKDDIYDFESIAEALVIKLLAICPELVEQRYKIDCSDRSAPYLEQIGRKRGFLLAGAKVDTERAARAVLDEFRAGKIGKITLERPV